MKIPTSKQINEFESAPEKIATAIRSLSIIQLNYKINPYEWNINQVIVHLADTEMFFYERMRKIIVEEKPVLQSFDQAEWAKKLLYDKQNYSFALELLIYQRKSTALLVRLLPQSTWSRNGLKDGKELTLYDIFITALKHIPTHLEQINNIKRNHKFPSS